MDTLGPVLSFQISVCIKGLFLESVWILQVSSFISVTLPGSTVCVK